VGYFAVTPRLCGYVRFLSNFLFRSVFFPPLGLLHLLEHLIYPKEVSRVALPAAGESCTRPWHGRRILVGAVPLFRIAVAHVEVQHSSFSGAVVLSFAESDRKHRGSFPFHAKGLLGTLFQRLARCIDSRPRARRLSSQHSRMCRASFDPRFKQRRTFGR
jgi:hypothetical protein